MIVENFIGKEVQLYPGDTDSKFGIIEEIGDKGFLIRITKSEAKHYEKGDIVFFSHSIGLKFKFKKKA